MPTDPKEAAKIGLACCLALAIILGLAALAGAFLPLGLAIPLAMFGGLVLVALFGRFCLADYMK